MSVTYIGLPHRGGYLQRADRRLRLRTHPDLYFERQVQGRPEGLHQCTPLFVSVAGRIYSIPPLARIEERPKAELINVSHLRVRYNHVLLQPSRNACIQSLQLLGRQRIRLRLGRGPRRGTGYRDLQDARTGRPTSTKSRAHHKHERLQQGSIPCHATNQMSATGNAVQHHNESISC